MKKFITVLAIVMILVAGTASAQAVKLVTDSWEPYSVNSLTGNGVTNEIVLAAFKAAGLQVELSFEPWKRCEASIEAGTAFATFPYLETEERKLKYNYSDPLITSKGKIFYWEGKGQDLAWTKYSDFGNVPWAGIAGYWYMEEFRKQGVRFETVSTLDQMLKMLQAGRIQYFIEDELACIFTAKKVLGSDLPKLKSVTKPNNVSTLHLMVSRTYPNSAEILAKFNLGLKTIKANGVYNTILAKYGIAP